MPFASACSTASSLDEAMSDVCSEVHARLDGAAPDLSLVFVSHHHGKHFDRIAAELFGGTGSRIILGCTGEAVACDSREIESSPAVSVWSAVMPGAALEPFHVEFGRTPDGIVATGFPSNEGGDDARAIVYLGEPFSSAPASVIARTAEEFPGVPLIGGMASGAGRPGVNRLFFRKECVERGGVGVVIRGGPRVRSIVSQGCRPIGTPFVVTKAEENVVFALGGVPPLKRFAQLFPDLSPRDQELAKNGLHLGLALDEYRESFGRGDFLISNVIGIDPEGGAVAIGNFVRVGQTVQFHVRDADSAHEDLVELLHGNIEDHAARPQAALLFSCNGRGTRLFPEPHHDARTIRELAGPIPLAGFFAQGEFGPVGKKNHIHGFTASVALFE